MGISMYPGSMIVALAVLVMQIVWILWWSAVAVATLSADDWSSWTLFVLLVSLYWNLEVLKNIGHCAVCGVAATWFFSEYQGQHRDPTLRSLGRAVTTSLGSVAFGSLGVALVSALREAVLTTRSLSKHQLSRAVLDCLLTCLQRVA